MGNERKHGGTGDHQRLNDGAGQCFCIAEGVNLIVGSRERILFMHERILFKLDVSLMKRYKNIFGVLYGISLQWRPTDHGQASSTESTSCDRFVDLQH